MRCKKGNSRAASACFGRCWTISGIFHAAGIRRFITPPPLARAARTACRCGGKPISRTNPPETPHAGHSHWPVAAPIYLPIAWHLFSLSAPASGPGKILKYLSTVVFFSFVTGFSTSGYTGLLYLAGEEQEAMAAKPVLDPLERGACITYRPAVPGRGGCNPGNAVRPQGPVRILRPGRQKKFTPGQQDNDAWTIEPAIEYMLRESGRHSAPKVIDACLRATPKASKTYDQHKHLQA